MNMKVAKVGLE